MLEVQGVNEDLFTKCVNFFCEELGISVPQLFIFADDDLPSTGVCYENEPGDYLIILRTRSEGDMIQSLAHELTHMKQYMVNKLSDQFDSTIPYMDRWWEQEAYAQETVLMESLIAKVQSRNF